MWPTNSTKEGLPTSRWGRLNFGRDSLFGMQLVLWVEWRGVDDKNLSFGSVASLAVFHIFWSVWRVCVLTTVSNALGFQDFSK